MSYGVRLDEAQRRYGHVCVGIDPHPGLLDSWGLPRSAEGVRAFGLRVIDALEGHIGVVKPQSALFEEYGSAGIAALEDVLAHARDAGILTILDVKRGDIGSTMAAYARAYLCDDSPLRADAITISPYLGFGSLAPAIDLAAQTGRGVYVLTLTSNLEAVTLQHATTAAGRAVARDIAEEAAARNADAREKHHLGHVGLVVGATTGSAVNACGIDLAAVNGSLLAPGLGAQGAGPAQVREVFADALANVLASSSRGVLRAGPDATSLRDAAKQTVEEVEDLIA
ncbi:orotidine-5'-phosphate decarboxylase [Nanchangia anserum]|uniref:orotidine-5'-phosphate decarboxylase n=1 Tax=Nanchangia anserum TaxID=2692125 RepID=UPI001D12437B|nr:orotidine-5'-phosphate decarboxylase [Nanchangia anserum]